MINGKKIIAIIPARGGSKGIHKKNIYPLAGKPLIQYSIEAALNSKYIDDTIVSTDDEEIANISKQLNAKIPFLRPKELAGDSVSSEAVIKHAISWYKKKDYDIFILLQPTSPLRTNKDIDNAIEILMNNNAFAVISVCRVRQHPNWMKTIDENGYLKNYCVDKKNNTRRQDLPEIFFPNGAIYMSTINSFIETESFNTAKTIPYIMDAFYSYDIDDLHDFMIVELMITHKLNLLP